MKFAVPPIATSEPVYGCFPWPYHAAAWLEAKNKSTVHQIYHITITIANSCLQSTLACQLMIVARKKATAKQRRWACIASFHG